MGGSPRSRAGRRFYKSEARTAAEPWCSPRSSDMTCKRCVVACLVITQERAHAVRSRCTTAVFSKQAVSVCVRGDKIDDRKVLCCKERQQHHTAPWALAAEMSSTLEARGQCAAEGVWSLSRPDSCNGHRVPQENLVSYPSAHVHYWGRIYSPGRTAVSPSTPTLF